MDRHTAEAKRDLSRKDKRPRARACGPALVDHSTPNRSGSSYAEFVTLYRALAAKSRQRAEYAEQALDFDLADSHTKLACGYAALAYSKQSLDQFESRTIVSPANSN
jgi:hypothetical protein